MGLLQSTLLVFLLIFSVCPKISVQAPTCSNNTFFIQYPFKLLQEGKKSHHMSPYVLKCNRQGLVVLSLPLSGEFFVRDIDYFQQKIRIYDPGNCLPGRLRNLSLSSSPFVAVSYQNYTFFSCPSESVSSRNLTAISCLSNSTASVVATPMVSVMDEIRNLTGCSVVYSLQAPVSQVFESLYNGIDSDLQLAWNDPRSKGERRGKPGVLTIITVCAITISTALLASLFCVGCGLSVIIVMLDAEEADTQRLRSYSIRVWKMARIRLSSQPQPVQAAAPHGGFSVTSSTQPPGRLSVAATLGESSPTPTSPSVVAGPLHAFFSPMPSPRAQRWSAPSFDGLSSTPSSPSVAADPLHAFFSPMPSPRAQRWSAPSFDGLSSTPSSPSVAADPHDEFLFMYPAEVPTLDDFSFMPPPPLPAAYDDELFFDVASDDELPTEDVVIGGSQWISGPNGDSCTICLGEYKAAERLRLIRKCNHCFHADCLVQWLQRKNTCPICRSNVT